MMTSKNTTQLPLVLLACAVFKNLLEKMLPDDLAAEVTFLDYGLHSLPKNLKIAVQEALDAIEEPSLVILGYGLCGNGLDGIQAGKHTLLIPRADDCIAIFLGSYAAYRREFNKNPNKIDDNLDKVNYIQQVYCQSICGHFSSLCNIHKETCCHYNKKWR